MPLGNHTSQFFANVYLNELDQFVKHTLKAKQYIRYVDDFVILSHSKEELEVWKEKIDQFLREALSLELHPDKSKIISLRCGVTFLGFRIFPYHRILRKANFRKFQGKFKELKILYKENQINREQVVVRLEGWMAYAKQGNTHKYLRNLLKSFNKHFSIRHTNQIMHSKKIRNFFRKHYASKVEFSVQKTLVLMRKGHSIKAVAEERGMKEGTVWRHCTNLIEHGQLKIWRILPAIKVARIISEIRKPDEQLKIIKSRISDRRITYDEVDCVRAHLRWKEKMIQKYPRKRK